MKILEEDVVSSWVRRMLSMTCQLRASCSSSDAKNLATLRSLLVSRRWISEYCRRKHSSKHSWYAGNFIAKRVASRAWYLQTQHHPISHHPAACPYLMAEKGGKQDTAFAILGYAL